MNFEQLCEIERNYLNQTKDFYKKPICRKRIKSMTIYQSGNWYYIFLLDYFICALLIDGGVGFYNESELKLEYNTIGA